MLQSSEKQLPNGLRDEFKSRITDGCIVLYSSVAMFGLNQVRNSFTTVRSPVNYCTLVQCKLSFLQNIMTSYNVFTVELQ